MKIVLTFKKIKPQMYISHQIESFMRQQQSIQQQWMKELKVWNNRKSSIVGTYRDL